ncbi:MAG: phosphate ABC transporter ATP-binding protein [Armatimonadota bacterium]
MSGTAVHIENLTVAYQNHMTLKDVNVSITPRSVTAIIGPSGCGKTTLLRTINRMIDLIPGTRVSGKVQLNELDIYSRGVDVTAIRRRVGLILQKPTPLPMSIFENVAYGPHIYGTGGRRKLQETVERSLTTAGLWDEVKDRLKEPASRLSLGQQQRLCLARGLAVEPEVLLFDEPTSSLDPISVVKIEQEIMRLKNDYTCVIVTHNLQQAMRIADHVLFVYLGELVEHGTAHQVFSSPKEAATASYIGNGI